MYTKYRVTVDGETRLEFEADLTQASAKITIDGVPTPFRTANASHQAISAARCINEWHYSEGGASFGIHENWIVTASGEEEQ